MPKVSEEHRLARRARILAAAVACFSRNGFDGTSMSDIIAESGLSAGSIYGHFRSKADLVQTTVVEMFLERAGEFEAELARDVALPPSQIVARFLRGLSSDVPNPSLLLQLWASAAGDGELRRIATEVVVDVQGIFGRSLVAWHVGAGTDPAEAESLAAAESLVCLGICQGYMVQSAIITDFDGEAYLAGITRLLPA